jgi:purine-binding chemotaxis protein CheW
MSSTTQTTVQRSDLAALAGKYLTFRLSREEYGLPVLKVREIIKLLEITAVPQSPPHVKGVINLRGKVIPVVDLRLKFSLPAQPYDEQTSIIVVEIAGAHGKILMGVIVETVCEVLNIAADEIEETPHFGDHVRTDYMRGVAKVKGTVKILLDLDRAFSVTVDPTEAVQVA